MFPRHPLTITIHMQEVSVIMNKMTDMDPTHPFEVPESPPFNPARARHYSPRELFRGAPAHPDDAMAFVQTLDFRSYAYFRSGGGAIFKSPYVAMVEAMHDASIIQATYQLMREVVKSGRLPMAIMGGHQEPRDSDTYFQIALTAKTLSEDGYFLASGGGPGCMEATHLGALFAGRSESDLKDAIRRLSIRPAYPHEVEQLLVARGESWQVDRVAMRAIMEWFLPALEISNELQSDLTSQNHSLAVPTWHYGHEITTPLATHISKFFLNSIREDILLNLAKSGVIFARGRAGTLQEIYQYAAGVYYGKGRLDHGTMPSMIFLDRAFWGVGDGCTESSFAVEPTLRALFTQYAKIDPLVFDEYWHFVDTTEEAVVALKRNQAANAHFSFEHYF